jgi:protocatechuate 3,4-dioxygenase beta subunit
MKRSRSKHSSASPSPARFRANRAAGVPRFAVVLSALGVIGLAVAGCDSGSTSQSAAGGTGSAPSATAASGNSQSAAQDGQGTMVSGQVIHGDTGEPYANAIVEFKNLYGGNVHTVTDADGRYSVELPPDTYTALALDSNDYNEGFNVVGRTDNAVTVPPSTTINFEGSPIT